MYGYEKYVELTKEEIFNRITEVCIFNIIIKEKIEIGIFYKAPYRTDKTPSCYFREHEGVLYFVDFADTRKQLKNCFDFLMFTLNLSYIETLNYINNYYKLGLGYSNNTLKESTIVNFEKKINHKNSRFFIIPIERVFDNRDKVFWSKYGITKKNLVDDGVLPIAMCKCINRDNTSYYIKYYNISYAYTDFTNNKVKIYSPITKPKWLTNCSKDDVGSIRHLPEKGELLIITKSYKDCRVIRNEGLNSIWFQNEGMIPNMLVLEDLCKRFDKIVVWFDNDVTGIAASKNIVNTIKKIKKEVKSISIPYNLLKENIKDPSDLIANKGSLELKKLISIL